MLLVGLTGNIASGKSIVSRLLAERGATLIDADVLARRAVEKGTPAFRQIVQRWGADVLGPDGGIDRAVLRRQVFGDQLQLDELNRIVHPEVTRLRDRLVADARARGDHIVVCDIPLLFDEFDVIVLVDAPRPMRLERLMSERGLDETEAMDMIVAQMPAELKQARADLVIETAGTLAALTARVDDVWISLEHEAHAASAPHAGLVDTPHPRP